MAPLAPGAEALFAITMYAVGCDVEEGSPTKAGTQPVIGFTAAADPSVLPIGSIIHVEGFGERLVHDVGGKVKGRVIDLYVGGCEEAREWGRRERKVRVVHRPSVTTSVSGRSSRPSASAARR